MFILADEHSYWWTCEAKVPADGKFETHDFELQFRSITPEEAAALDAKIREADLKGDAAARSLALQAVVTGWRRIVDTGKHDIAFSAENLARACAYPWFRIAAFQGWQDSQNGIERKRGN